MANVMTKVQKFDAIAKALDGVELEGFDVQEFLAHEIEQTNKRNARKSTSPSKTQKENSAIKARILEVLADSEGMTASEVAKALDLSSPQKASALLHQLIDGKQVEEGKRGKSKVFILS